MKRNSIIRSLALLLAVSSGCTQQDSNGESVIGIDLGARTPSENLYRISVTTTRGGKTWRWSELSTFESNDYRIERLRLLNGDSGTAKHLVGTVEVMWPKLPNHKPKITMQTTVPISVALKPSSDGWLILDPKAHYNEPISIGPGTQSWELVPNPNEK